MESAPTQQLKIVVWALGIMGTVAAATAGIMIWVSNVAQSKADAAQSHADSAISEISERLDKLDEELIKLDSNEQDLRVAVAALTQELKDSRREARHEH